MGSKSKVFDTTSEEESDDDLFTVEKLLDKKVVKGRVLYLVQWKDYDSSHNSWEPVQNFSECKEAIDEFEAEQSRKLAEEPKPTKKKKVQVSQPTTLKTSKHEVSCNEKPVKYADKIIGITDEISQFNPKGEMMFLIKYSDNSAELIEKSAANANYPLQVIHYYEKHLKLKPRVEQIEKPTDDMILGC